MMIIFFLIKTYVVMKKRKLQALLNFESCLRLSWPGMNKIISRALLCPLAGCSASLPSRFDEATHIISFDEVLVPASAHVVARGKFRQMIIFTSHTPWFPFCPAAGLKRTLRPQILKGPLICHKLGKYGRVNDFPPVSLVAADLQIACCLLLSQKE